MSYSNDTKPSSTYSNDTKITIVSYLLLENGGKLLLEDGGGIILTSTTQNSYTNDIKP
jgi:hypothetical protein